MGSLLPPSPERNIPPEEGTPPITPESLLAPKEVNPITLGSLLPPPPGMDPPPRSPFPPRKGPPCPHFSSCPPRMGTPPRKGPSSLQGPVPPARCPPLLPHKEGTPPSPQLPLCPTGIGGGGGVSPTPHLWGCQAPTGAGGAPHQGAVASPVGGCVGGLSVGCHREGGEAPCCGCGGIGVHFWGDATMCV